MAERYRQLTLLERQQIKEGLDRGDSLRKIAQTINRSPATISHEIRENRMQKAFRPRKAVCRDKNWCRRMEVCGDSCTRKGAYCSGCDRADCRDRCPAYAEQTACDILTRSPWVCNECSKNRYGCNRANRWVYDANVADASAKSRRSESRRGIDLPRDRAEVALCHIRDGLSRGLSPYEISKLYADCLSRHPSTIYRWVERGYGGLTSMELERKVGFRVRRKNARRSSSHDARRRYSEFERLSDDIREACTEMDTVIGRRIDTQVMLTLYNRPSGLQLALLMRDKTPEETVRTLKSLKKACSKEIFELLTRCVLTDNGTEFADENEIGTVLGEVPGTRDVLHLYYCDPRQSQQKGGCEKNHTEFRQVLKKGLLVFDELNEKDLAVAMSHVNSNPRAKLHGMSPIAMFKKIYGEEGERFLNALGIEEIGRDDLLLKPEILNMERRKRGERPLTFLK